jgi:hypothetical protein
MNEKIVYLFQKLIFQNDYYLVHNLDVLSSGIDPYAHWKKHGKHEKRFFSSKLDFSGKVKSVNLGTLKKLISKEIFDILTEFLVDINNFYIDSWNPGRSNWGFTVRIKDFNGQVNKESIIYPKFLQLGNKGGLMIKVNSELIINIFKGSSKEYLVYFNLGIGPTNNLIRQLVNNNMYLDI